MIGIRLRLLPAQQRRSCNIICFIGKAYILDFFFYYAFFPQCQGRLGLKLSSYLWRNTGVFQNWKPIRDTLTDIQSTESGHQPFHFRSLKGTKKIILNVKSYWIKKSPCFTSRFTAWKKLFGKITQSFGDISVGKGRGNLFFLLLLFLVLKNTLLKIQCYILVFLLTYHYWKSLVLMMISSSTLVLVLLFQELKKKKLPRIPS